MFDYEQVHNACGGLCKLQAAEIRMRGLLLPQGAQAPDQGRDDAQTANLPLGAATIAGSRGPAESGLETRRKPAASRTAPREG